MSLRVLLVNPPIYDYRYTWEKWHQPVSLLKLATYLKNIGVETRLFDFLTASHGGKVRRQLIGKNEVEGFKLRKYRFGITKTDFYNKLKEYKASGWIPHELWMSTMVTYWWPALLEVRDITMRVFPDIKVKIGGLYPTLFPEHAAKQFNADSIVKGLNFHNYFVRGNAIDNGNTTLVIGNIPQACFSRPDYQLLPHAKYAVFQVRSGLISDNYGDDFILPCGRNPFRSVSEIYNDIFLWNKEFGIDHFTCYDDKIAASDHGLTLKLLLKEIINNKLNIKLHFINGLYPEDIDEEMARLLKEAGTSEIYFMPTMVQKNEEKKIVYESLAILLKKAGFKLRDLTIGGYFFVGAPQEDLVKVLESGLTISRTLGFAIPVFYTPSPWIEDFTNLSSTLDVEVLSPHLFPLRHNSPLNYYHYDEIMRLFAMLNYPVKGATFNFFGEGKVAKVLRKLVKKEISYNNEQVYHF